MQINKYAEHIDMDAALRKGDPLLAVISFDGRSAWTGHVDECMEHHILLAKAGLSSADIDKYFRIVFDGKSADWTFVCPSDYRGISDREARIGAFYRDGFAAIASFASELGLFLDVRIPRRYRRHWEALGNP